MPFKGRGWDLASCGVDLSNADTGAIGGADGGDVLDAKTVINPYSGERRERKILPNADLDF